VFTADIDNGRSFLVANRTLLSLTTGAERASVRKVYRGRQVTFKYDSLFPAPWSRHRYSGKQGLDAGMPVLVKQTISLRLFHDHAQIHDDHPVGNVPNHGKIVCDEKTGETMDFDALTDDFPHRHSGIERRKGVLKDCGYIRRVDSNGIAAPSVDEHRFGKSSPCDQSQHNHADTDGFQKLPHSLHLLCNSPAILQFHQKHEINPF
jgi:hypothetical protein